jgi:hypothetical protein
MKPKKRKQKKQVDDWDLEEEREILESWMVRNFGKRCFEYEPGCIVCEKYKLYDKLQIE